MNEKVAQSTINTAAAGQINVGTHAHMQADPMNQLHKNIIVR